MKRWKKVFMLMSMAVLVLSLCACTTTTKDTPAESSAEGEKAAEATPEPTPQATPNSIKAEQVNDPFGDAYAAEEDKEPKEEVTEKTEEQKPVNNTTSDTEESEPVNNVVEDESIFAAPIAPVSYISIDDPKAEYLVQNLNKMRRWQMGFQTISTTFPSTKELTGDKCIQLSNVNELNAYFTEYNDIWATSEDELSATCKKYVYKHDWFYDQEIKSNEGNLQYYIIENPGFYPLAHYEVDESNIYYDETTKTVYITLFMGFDYEEYLEKFTKDMAEKVKAEAKSNRMLLVVNFPDEEINEIVIVKPRDWE